MSRATLVIQIGRAPAMRRLATSRDGAELDVHSSVFHSNSSSVDASSVARSSHQVIRESSIPGGPISTPMFHVWQMVSDLSSSHCRGRRATLVWCSATRCQNFFMW